MRTSSYLACRPHPALLSIVSLHFCVMHPALISVVTLHFLYVKILTHPLPSALCICPSHDERRPFPQCNLEFKINFETDSTCLILEHLLAFNDFRTDGSHVQCLADQ